MRETHSRVQHTHTKMESPEREEDEAAAAVEVEDFVLDSDGEKPGWVTSPALRRQRTLFRRVGRINPPTKKRNKEICSFSASPQEFLVLSFKDGYAFASVKSINVFSISHFAIKFPGLLSILAADIKFAKIKKCQSQTLFARPPRRAGASRSGQGG